MAKLKSKKKKIRAKIFKKTKPAKNRKVLNKKSKIKNPLRSRSEASQKSKFKLKPQKLKAKTKKITIKPQKPESKEKTRFTAESLFKARIKVIGIGGGGGSIVSEIGRSLGKATFVVADTDIRALKKKSGIKYLWFGGDLTRGLGTGVNIDLAKQAAEEAKDKISETFKDQDIIIFIASLGGGLGSGATQVFAEEAKKYGAITMGIFTLPFKFEGKNKARIAQNALKALRQDLNVSLTIPNEKIFKIINESTPITTAFSVVNKSLINSLESLIDLIYSPGIINIDFADLRTILKGRGNLAFLNTIEESGKNRSDKICERVFVNPLLQSGSFGAEKILFNIMGSENLSMFEVEKISSHISKSNPKAKIIFGISKNPKLKNKIKTTILMAGGGGRESNAIFVPQKEPSLKAQDASIQKAQEKNADIGSENKAAQKSKKAKAKTQVKHPKSKGNGADSVRNLPEELPPVLSPPVFSEPAVKLKENTVLKRSAIRRSGLEIKKAEEQEEKKRIDQEKEWEIPAFLRKVKFNK